MTWRFIPSTEGKYEYDDETLAVRNAETCKEVRHRAKKHGVAFVRLSLGGKKRDLSLARLGVGFTGPVPQEGESAVCSICGRTFSPLNGRSRFCSEKCKKKNDNEKYNGFHIRRAKKYGVPYEHGITLPEVIERFGGVCQICGKATDRGVFAMMPTIDHIVPMKRGGGHTWDNVQLACMKCNSMKGDGE